MRLENAEEVVWQRERRRLLWFGFAEVDPGWREAYLGSMEGRAGWLYRLVDWLARRGRG